MTTDSEKMKSRYKKYRKILKNLTIMSDVFMRNVLKDRKCTEYILQVIMEKKNLKIVDQVLQKDYKNLQILLLLWTVYVHLQQWLMI